MADGLYPRRFEIPADRISFSRSARANCFFATAAGDGCVLSMSEN